MKVEELIELYNRVYGVSNPKLQFLDYSDVQSNSVNMQSVIALPKMSWLSFKQNYYNSVLYFFGEKAIGYVSLNGNVGHEFVSAQFVHLCSVIDSLNFSDNDQVEIFFLTGEFFLDVNINDSTFLDEDSLEFVGSNKVDYVGAITGKKSNITILKHRRNTPVLLIQYDNSVKMW